jgi:hypothetical protein
VPNNLYKWLKKGWKLVRGRWWCMSCLMVPPQKGNQCWGMKGKSYPEWLSTLAQTASIMKAQLVTGSHLTTMAAVVMKKPMGIEELAGVQVLGGSGYAAAVLVVERMNVSVEEPGLVK